MMNFFQKKQKCNFCDSLIEKDKLFVLQYKAIDGIGQMYMCLECGNRMNDIVNIWESLNEKNY